MKFFHFKKTIFLALCAFSFFGFHTSAFAENILITNSATNWISNSAADRALHYFSQPGNNITDERYRLTNSSLPTINSTFFDGYDVVVVVAYANSFTPTELTYLKNAIKNKTSDYFILIFERSPSYNYAEDIANELRNTSYSLTYSPFNMPSRNTQRNSLSSFSDFPDPYWFHWAGIMQNVPIYNRIYEDITGGSNNTPAFIIRESESKGACFTTFMDLSIFWVGNNATTRQQLAKALVDAGKPGGLCHLDLLSVDAPNTSNTTPDISGNTDAPAGSNVVINITDAQNNTHSITTTVQADGSYSATVTQNLALGEYTVDVEVRDSSNVLLIAAHATGAIRLPDLSKKSKSSIKYICSDPAAENYNPTRFGYHRDSWCTYSKKPTQPISQCPVFTQYMRKGDRDGYRGRDQQAFSISPLIHEVLLLQKTLTDLGFNPKTNQDGIFGTVTENAIHQFQKTYPQEILEPWKLNTSTGRFYQTTKKQLNAVLGCSEN